MDRVQGWIAEQIDGCSPDKAADPRRAVQDLVRALGYFAGKSALVFGMSAPVASLAQREELRASCAEQLRRWYDRVDEEERRAIYLATSKLELGLELPEPESVARERERESRIAAALSRLPSPSAALASTWPEGADAVRALFERGRASKKKFGKAFAPGPMLRASQFEWCGDDWRDVIACSIDPAFFPIAGADGDAIGFYLDPALLRAGLGAPVLHYFHEQDPTYTWVCEGPSQALALLAGASKTQGVDRGCRPAAVDALVASFAAGGKPDTPTRRASYDRLWNSSRDGRAVYEAAGHVFATAYLDALAIGATA